MINKPKPSFAPLYCGLYPELALIFKEHGYSLTVHGSVQSDFDLVAIPWTKNPSTPKEVIKQITTDFSFNRVGEPDMAEHGRVRWPLWFSFGGCYADLSFMPIRNKEMSKAEALKLIDEDPDFAAEALITAIADSEYFQNECKNLRG